MHGFAALTVMAEYVSIENFLEGITIHVELSEYERLLQHSDYAIKIREAMTRRKEGTGEYSYPLEEERNSIFSNIVSGQQQTDGQVFHWNTASTFLLIRPREDFEPQFTKPKGKKIKLWNVIRDILHAAGYAVSAPECDRKRRNLLAIYKRRKDTSKKSGEGAQPYWEFEEVLESFLGGKPSIDPPQSHLVSSLSSNPSPSCSSSSPSPSCQMSGLISNLSPSSVITHQDIPSSIPYENSFFFPSTSSSQNHTFIPSSSDTGTPNPSPSHVPSSSVIPPSVSATPSRQLKRKRDSPPPKWFVEYVERKEALDQARLQRMEELENKKIEAIKDLTSVIREMIAKK